MRLGVLVLLAMALAACSNSTPVAPASATESATMVEKNCADPQWKDKNRVCGIRCAASRCTGERVPRGSQNFLKHSWPVPSRALQSTTIAGVLTLGGICTT